MTGVSEYWRFSDHKFKSYSGKPEIPAIQEKDRWAAAVDYLLMNSRKSRFGMPTSIDTVAAGLRAPRLSVSL